MKQKCFIDTTIILRIIFQKDKVLLNKLVKEFELYSSPNVLEEATFKIIVETLKEIHGEINLNKIKSIFEGKDLPNTL